MHTILLTNEMSSEIVYIPYLSLDMAGYSYSLLTKLLSTGDSIFTSAVHDSLIACQQLIYINSCVD
jgi:hypothetical protein